MPEHFFIVLLKGTMKAFDGNKQYKMVPGDYFIVRKNHLVRFARFKDDVEFEKIVIRFDEDFLKDFFKRHPFSVSFTANKDSFQMVQSNKLIDNYSKSLTTYFSDSLKLDQTFSDVKREELLLILLRAQPELADIFFKFGVPEKLDLEEFMNRNFQFNIGLKRFAYLTGRSLSAFKRDFAKVFNETPSRWLIERRLEEAYFLLEVKKRKSSEIYLELGFEALSHFSFAFKRRYGFSPIEMNKRKGLHLDLE